MYETTGRYYALFGPAAVVTEAEERFLHHWARGRQRALDFGAGLCGPAMQLARLGLDVLAFEPSSVLAVLALDRLARHSDLADRVTLVEGRAETFEEPFAADLLLMRSVWMLLDDAQRQLALRTLRRHCAPGARLLLDARTAALPWADHPPPPPEEKRIGHTTIRRSTRYARRTDGTTEVHWMIDVVRFGRPIERAEERFAVRADSAPALRTTLAHAGFAVEQLYSAYDLEAPFTDAAPMLVAVAAAV